MKMQYLLSGSPTAELFAASYNNTGKSNTITLVVGAYGYDSNSSGYNNFMKNWFKPEDNHGIFNKGSSYRWWIASPSANDSYGNGGNYGMYVDGETGSLSTSFGGSTFAAVRPLVCIPTSVFNSKYATDTTLVDE